MIRIGHLCLVLLTMVICSEASDPYRVLGVSRQATDQQIKKAFKDLSLKHHPDVAGQGTDEVYAEIVNAYELLKDKDRRARYDTTGSTGQILSDADENAAHQQRYRGGGFGPGGFVNLDDIFREFERQMHGQHENDRRHEQQRSQQRQQSQRRQANNFEFNSDEYEVVNFIDGFGRMRMAVVRKQKGVLGFLSSLLSQALYHPFQLFLLCLLLYFLLTALQRVNQ